MYISVLYVYVCACVICVHICFVCVCVCVRAQRCYNGHCHGGDFRRQMAGILTISHLRHSPTSTSQSASRSFDRRLRRL